MKGLVTLLLLTCSLSLQAQEDIRPLLIGKWKMIEVVQDGNDVSKEHNPESNRYIVLRTDGSFESGGDPYGKNTGKFFVDETKSRLMIDSDAGEGDDSMWTVSIKEDKMIWTGIGSEWAERFVIVSKRVED